MGMKNVGFVIKIPLSRETTATQKAIDKQKSTIVDMHKKELPKLSKVTKQYLKETKTGFRDTEVAAKRMGKTFARSMDDGLRGLNKFGDRLGKLRGQLLNLKTVLAGTAVGVAAIWAGKKLYEGGKANLATRGRISREFGDEAEGLEVAARAAGRKAGVSTDEMTKGLIPFRERLDDIEAGAQFRGMKKKLTAEQAAKLREKNLAFGAGLLSRVSTLAPDIDANAAGSVLADALSGPEGIKRLVSEFNLSKRSRTVAAANEKGEVYKFLREEERKKYNVTKKGQYLEQGDLVSILLERSGMTEAAAEAKRKKLDFQLKAIGATAENALADIGSRALEKFNGGMAKGASLSEKFENAIKSKEGQRVLDSISNAVVGIAEGAVKIATTVPRIGTFLSEHKTTLLALGGAFAGLKAMNFIGGKSKEVTGGAGGVLGALGIGKQPIPVYIVAGPGGIGGMPEGVGGSKVGKGAAVLGAASAALTAGMLGYGAGSYLEEKYDISGGLDYARKLATSDNRDLNAVDKQVKGSWLDIAIASIKGKDALAAEAAKQQKQLVENFVKHPDQYASPVMIQPQSTPINMDGQKVAEMVTKYQVRKMQNDTANGAAPTHRK